ncbi:MAG: type II toxin-antitoxin system VapC family toxin [Proteobacteria bacterium]|nr:type II toxin-antitoxin system VapC family toxin [Pseudomonadota bacterium]
MLYLDTHVVVWLFQNDKSLFPDEAIERINSHKNELIISPIVTLEVEYLFEINRIRHSGKETVDFLVNRINLNICKHSFADVVSHSLSVKWTRDPFDRIITSQAAVNKANLLTKDRIIHDNFEAAVW